MDPKPTDEQLDAVSERHSKDDAYALLEWTTTHSVYRPHPKSRHEVFWDARLL